MAFELHIIQKLHDADGFRAGSAKAQAWVDENVSGVRYEHYVSEDGTTGLGIDHFESDEACIEYFTKVREADLLSLLDGIAEPEKVLVIGDPGEARGMLEQLGVAFLTPLSH